MSLHELTWLWLKSEHRSQRNKNDWNNNIIQYLVRSSLMATKNVWVVFACRCRSPPKIIMINIFTETEICQNVCWVHRQLPSAAPSHSHSRWVYFSSSERNTHVNHRMSLKATNKKRLKSKNEIHDKNVCLAKIAPSSRASKQAARVKRRKMESIYLGFIKIHKNRGFVQLQSLAAF